MRPGTGPNAMRPAAGLAQPGLAQPGHAQSSLAQPTVAQYALGQQGAGQQGAGQQGAGQQGPGQQGPGQPSFQPNAGRGSARQPEHSDWAERTERIDRIAPGYPDPRAAGRGQASRGPAAASSGPSSLWGRDDQLGRRPQDPGQPSRTGGNAANGTRRRAADDDPLTSKAFSREALVNTDGRSYRVASRRAKVSPDRYAAALTDQTQTFGMDGQYVADPPAASRYPVRGGQQPGRERGQQPGRQPGQPSGQQQSRQPRHRGDAHEHGTASNPYDSQPYPSRAAAPGRDEDRYGRSARPGGYDGGYVSGYGADGHRDNGRHNGSGRGGYRNGY